MRGWCAIPILVAAAAGVPAAHAQRVVEEAVWAPFRAIVDRYQRGDITGAVDALLALGAEAVRQSFIGAAPDARQRLTIDVRAAAMLHADAADAVWQRDRHAAMNHVTAGRQWADAAEKAAPAFRRRWYLASGLLLVEKESYESNVDFAARHFADACELMPDDVPLLTVASWLDEQSALAPARWDVRRDQHATAPRRAKGVFLRRAHERLMAALQVDPDAAEPALRVGRLRTLLGNPAGARLILEPLAARPDLAVRDAYLARLFLARALEIEGDRTRALDLYREAQRLIPAQPAARFGLARLLYAGGDPAGAAEALEPALLAPPAAAEDPWIDYLVGHVGRGPRLREVLRREVVR